MSGTLTAAELDELEEKLTEGRPFIATYRTVFRALLALARKGLECDADRTTYLRVLAGMAGERDALAAELAELRAAAEDVIFTDPLSGGLSHRPTHCQESAAEYSLNDCQCALCASVRHQRKKHTLAALLTRTPEEGQ